MATGDITIRSFDWQWQNLSNDPSKYLLSSPLWREKVDELILEELGVDALWLKGKEVLDVGCGNGRWLYGFQKLGCFAFGIDTSPSGVEYARSYGLQAHVLNLFDMPNAMEKKFDLVWCWGVIHHTANPCRAFSILAQATKPGGLVHCYVYSNPRSLGVKAMRSLLKPFNFTVRRRLISVYVKMGLYHGTVHEAFDALSPAINKEIPESEIQGWCRNLGLRYERRNPLWAKGSKDIFFNAWRAETQDDFEKSKIEEKR